MKIGIGTSDGVNVCDHLARASAFIIVELENGKAAGRTVRHRPDAACGRHATFTEMLEGCDVALCGGIGQGAVDALVAAGIQPLVLAGALPVDEALARYLEGRLATTSARVCLCGPGH